MVRSLTPFFLVALAVGAQCVAAEPSTNSRRATSLALDFCGTFAGEKAALIEETAAGIRGLSLSTPSTLAAIDADDEARASFRKMLNLDDGDTLRFAAFAPDPSPRTAPFAAITSGGDICLVVVQSGEPAIISNLEARLGAEGSAWKLDVEDGGKTWSRPAPFNERVFLVSSTHPEITMIVVAVEKREASTAGDIAAQVRGAVAPCVDAILAGRPARTADFQGVYAEYERSTNKQNAEVQVLDLRANVGPRAWLQVRWIDTVSICELLTSDPQQPFDDVLAAVNGVVTNWPGAKEVDVKADEHEPAHKAWRVKKRGAGRKADIAVTVERENIIKVTVKLADSWFW